METKWTAAVAEDLQALAKLAALHLPERPAQVSVESDVVPRQVQRAALRHLTLDAYEQWAARYPEAADALERSLEGVAAPESSWRPPVVQVEQVLAWSLPAVKAALVRWFRTWPANAPMLRGGVG